MAKAFPRKQERLFLDLIILTTVDEKQGKLVTVINMFPKPPRGNPGNSNAVDH
jgi:hypothetical protein